jgi:glycerate dehydrogenase
MRIVILDGYTTNPGDLHWQGLEALGSLSVFDRTAESEILERAAGAEVVLTNKTPLRAETIGALPRLKYIGVLATGYNVVDLAAAMGRGITVTNVPGYGTQAVAQHAIALLLELTRGAGRHSDGVHRGRWSCASDWSYSETPQVDLHGLTLGIVGYGSIGRQTAAIAASIGMRVQTHTRRDPVDGTPNVDLPTLLKSSDVVSLHCPLTPDTQDLISRDSLQTMKTTSFLINTARGPLIDEEALAEALQAGGIGGAGLDVLRVEPPPPDHPLFGLRNCIITPHLAWATSQARLRLLEMATENVRSFLAGNPTHVVSR